LLTCYVYSTKIGEISDISKCFENFVSQALGVLTRIYAAELRLYILISNQFRNYIRRTTVGGIDKRALNVRQISSFPIISPPLHLQHLFAQRIEQIEHQKSEVAKAITDLETLLASRMQHWFE